MSQKPLERLNYYNGQRLEASDLKLEQEYHIGVRRWLNKSLYSPGIARGLDVRAEPKVPRVVVGPGLALDADGHEIILWDEERVDVVGDARHHQGSGSEAEVEGLYLTIRYDERLTSDAPAVCATAGKGRRCDRPANGGPSRVLARPLFAWRRYFPDEGSGEVVLAQVELDDTCSEVHQIDTGVRRYVGAASAAKVRQYALEGEREVAFIPKELFSDPKPARDVESKARVYFHIRGRQPNAVILYLRGERLSTLHYTELASHTHALDVKLAQVPDGIHRHALGEHETYGNSAAHSHSVATEFINLANALPPMLFIDQFLNNVPDGALSDAGRLILGVGGALQGVNRTGTAALTGQKRLVISPVFAVSSGANVQGNFPRVDPAAIKTATEDPVHVHSVGRRSGVDELTLVSDPNSAHTHAFSARSASNAGAVDPNDPTTHARTGVPLTFVDDLQVSIGRTDAALVNHTTNILGQLTAGNSAWQNVSRLGNATDGHVFATKGTGPVRLDFLPGVAFTEGEYYIEFHAKQRLDPNGTRLPNGGRVIYNLYVE